MAWEFKKNLPLFVQISDRIRRDIVLGTYSAGEQLPTVRQLAFTASANPNTVQHALAILEDEGLIVTRGTAGKFITSDTELLCAARKKIKAHTIEGLLKEALELGISAEEIVEYVKEAHGI